MSKFCPRCKGTRLVPKNARAGHSNGYFDCGQELIPCPLCNTKFNRKRRKK